MTSNTSALVAEWVGPVTHIVAKPLRLSGRVADMWRYRDVLFFLVWRDLKVRYRQTVLGVAWAVLQPLLLMGLFTIFFGRLAHVPSDGAPYVLFAYVGLLPWTYFANAVTVSGNSLATNPDLITKVYLPRVLIPLAAVVAGLLDFSISAALLVGLMIWFHTPVTPMLLLLAPLAVLMIVFTFATGTWLAAINVRYRDVRHALPFLVQLWLFATPVIYPSSLVPERWKPLLLVNPLVGIVEGFRSSVLGRPLDGRSLGVSVVLTVAALVMSLRYFARVEQDFADVV